MANLKNCVWALATLLGACVGSDERSAKSASLVYRIAFPPLYSAFGGSHSYSVTPFIAKVLGRETYSQVDVSTIEWHVDERYVEREDFESFPHAAKLTTKRAGETTVALTATSVNGITVRAESKLIIREATDEEWEKGDARYSGGQTTPPQFRSVPSKQTETTCGVPSDFLAPGMVEDAACISCHNSEQGLSNATTPTQIARYSDEELSTLAVDGETPPGYPFVSFLRFQRQPACVYTAFHKRSIDEQTQLCLFLRLRSVPPEAYPDLDLFMFGELTLEARQELMRKIKPGF